ncbi:MAG: PilZ domain-containing protein [Candidatus Angelobacter sp.]
MEPFSALLLSTDTASLSTMKKVLEEYGVSVKVAASPTVAVHLIKTTKFDLAVLDHDVPGALELAAGRSPIANPKMIFGLVRKTALQELAEKRIHFMVQKPFTADLFARSLRAAYGPMIRDRRTAFRHAVQVKPVSAVLIQDGGTQGLRDATILDLSQDGMCIQTQEILPQGVTLQIEFQIPESRVAIHVTGRVMWTRASGRTGLEFTQIAATEQKDLISWLDSRLPYLVETLPRQVPVRATA